MTFSRCTLLCVLLVAAASAAFAAPVGSGPAPKPWSLRDKYTVTVGNMTLNYDVKTAEWHLVVDGAGPVMDDVGFRITFADGSTLDASQLGPGVTDRERFTSEAGEGNCFGVEFPVHEGLAVRHSLSVHSGRPYVHLDLAVSNTGDEAIEVARIDPGVVGPKGVHDLSDRASMSLRHVAIRGSYPVFNRNGAAVGATFSDPGRAVSFSVGVLPLGVATSDVAFRASGVGWQGGITGAFRPAVRLEPGGELRADPVWVLIGAPAPAEVDEFYSWATTIVVRSRPCGDVPGCWVGVEEGAGVGDLCRAIGRWRSAGSSHALVPWTWEGRPGSLKGAAPRWPASMGKAADQIRATGVKAGLSVDPLLVAGGASGFTASSADGRTWLNASVPKGRAYGLEHLKKVVGWGYDFYVVHASEVPDEVLGQFNLTRAQADLLAFSLMSEAAGERPVLPSVAMSLAGGLDEWLEAAAATSRMAEQGVKVGPVGFDATGVADMGEDVLAAMGFFNGPIALVGKPKPAVAKALGEFLSQRRRPGRPLDAAHPAPKVWQVHMAARAGRPGGDSVVTFPGAPAWEIAQIDLDAGQARRVWRAKDGAFLDPQQRSLPAASELTVYGVTPVLERPVLLGASEGTGLLLDDLSEVVWEETAGKRTGVLHGAFKGSHGKGAHAYVAIPVGWSFKSGKAGGAVIRKREVTDRLRFFVRPGGSTGFEFEFTRD